MTVPAAAVCRLDSDTVNGNITVSGQLYASSLTVSGALSSSGGKVVQIDSSTISGSVTVAGLANGPVDQDSVSIVINSIGGNLIVRGNTSPTGDELASSNTVHGSEADAFNTITGDPRDHGRDRGREHGRLPQRRPRGQGDQRQLRRQHPRLHRNC